MFLEQLNLCCFKCNGFHKKPSIHDLLQETKII